jgi:hypothetical protein
MFRFNHFSAIRVKEFDSIYRCFPKIRSYHNRRTRGVIHLYDHPIHGGNDLRVLLTGRSDPVEKSNYFAGAGLSFRAL